MTKEDFIKLGVDKDLAEKLADASKSELEGYVEKSKYDVAAEAKKNLETQVKEHAKQIDELKKSVGDTDKLNATIASLQDANKKANEEYAKSLKDMQINHAIEASLKDAKAKNLTATKALLDLSTIEVEDGKVKGLDKQIKKLVEGEDTKFLFDVPPNPTDGKPDAGIKPAGESGSEQNSGDGNNNSPSIGERMAQAYNAFVNPSASPEK